MLCFFLTFWPEIILKSYEAAIEKSCAKVLFCNCAQNIEKEVVRFLVKLQERSMQLNCKWTSSRVFFKDFNQKFISLTLWNSHFHNTKCRRTPLSGWFWHFGTCPFEIIFVKQQQSVLHFLLQKSCNVTQGLFKYVFCYWNELLWRFIIWEFCVTFYRG